MVVFIDFQFSDFFANPDLHPCIKIRGGLRHHGFLLFFSSRRHVLKTPGLVLLIANLA